MICKGRAGSKLWRNPHQPVDHPQFCYLLATSRRQKDSKLVQIRNTEHLPPNRLPTVRGPLRPRIHSNASHVKGLALLLALCQHDPMSRPSRSSSATNASARRALPNPSIEWTSTGWPGPAGRKAYARPGQPVEVHSMEARPSVPRTLNGKQSCRASSWPRFVLVHRRSS
jgi:hypothetical protein